MNIYAKYELLELVPDPEIRSFHARELSSGRKVVMHLMVRGYTTENNRILYRILHLPAESRQRIVEVGEYEGVPFVVTEELGIPLTEWLSGQAAAAASPVIRPRAEDLSAPPPATAPPQPEAPPAAGEFTKIFGLQPAPAPQSAGQSPQPGEFTLLFEVQGPTPYHAAPAAPAAAPAAPVSPPASSVPLPAAGAPGEFTRLFASQPASQGQPSERPLILPAPSVEPLVPPVSSTRDLDATSVFHTSGGPVAPVMSPQTPGEFTRLISQRPEPPQPLRAPPPARTADADPSRARNTLIVVLIFLGLAALALILFFAVMRD